MSRSTKQALAKTLKQLMEHTPFEKITVKELVQACGVNRQTFYYHFKDIYELLGWIYTTETYGSLVECRSYGTWQQGLQQVLAYICVNSGFCLNTYHSLARDHLYRFLRSVTFELLLDVVNELARDTAVSMQDRKLIADFYTYGILGVLIDWMDGGLKEPPEVVVKKLARLLEGDFKRAIEKYAATR